MDEQRQNEIVWRSKLYWEIFDRQREEKPFLMVGDLIQATNAIYEKWTLDDIHDKLEVLVDETLRK